MMFVAEVSARQLRCGVIRMKSPQPIDLERIAATAT
jgi:hypothetical protein